MKRTKKILVFLIVMTLIFSTTIFAYAASGQVNYTYSADHILWFAESDMGIGTVVPVAVTSNIGATFKYSSSDTQSRTYNNEEYWAALTSNALDYYTSNITLYLFNLEVYPEKGSVRTCSSSYTPSILIEGFRTAKKGSNTTIEILKGGNSYGQLRANISGGSGVNGVTDLVYFTNLGSAIGNITATTVEPHTIPGNELEIMSGDDATLNKVDAFAEIIEEKLDQEKLEMEDLTQRSNKCKMLMDYANKKGLTATDREVNLYLEELLTSYKKAQEYGTIEKACNRVGTTFENLVRKDFACYKAILTQEKLFADFKQNYIEKKAWNAKEITETKDNEIRDAWECFKANLMKTSDTI